MCIRDSLIIGIVIPTFLLHIRYYLINFRVGISIDNEILTVNYRNTKKIVTPQNTIRVDDYLSKSIAEQRLKWLPWDEYRHVKLHLNDGTIIILTSLLIDDFDFFYRNGFSIKEHKNIFRWV